MNVKLIVSSGKSAGRAISIKRPTLLIGRAEECDVRPLSEDVSRRHCAVHVGPADVWVEDLGSRNGTFVNGTRITGKVKVANGDMLRVGVLEVKISCAAPAAAAGSEEDVSRWLLADESPAGMFDTTQTVRTPAATPAADPANVLDEPAQRAEGGSTIAKMSLEAVKASKSSPGMLPTAGKKSSDSSRDAAAEALKKFFGNR